MPVRFTTAPGAAFVDRESWNRLAADASPLMEWEYYHALERSGCARRERGFVPRHVCAWEGERLVALAPLYQRDRAWVEFGDGGLLEFLSQLTGLPYGSGFLAATPFTPVPGYRFLCGAGEGRHSLVTLLLQYLDFTCETEGLTTSRVYFCARDDGPFEAALGRQGYVGFETEHALWFNGGYRDFADFLSTFRSQRRIKIRRELRDLAGAGVSVRMVPGTEAPESLFSAMYGYYLATWVKYMGQRAAPFLNEAFFLALAEDFRHRVVFSVAERGARIIGMAIFYEKDGQLQGRYWGSREDVPFLHFATCYYAPIEYAINRGISVMDPGFGGDHKIIRGFEPVRVSHYIKFFGERERALARAVLHEMETDPAER